MEIGDPEREYVVEPVIDPVPRELPDREREPAVTEPQQEPVPAQP